MSKWLWLEERFTNPWTQGHAMCFCGLLYFTEVLVEGTRVVDSGRDHLLLPLVGNHLMFIN